MQTMSSKFIFDFNKQADIQDWIVVDDVVMGGRSSGTFALNDDGFGVFEGNVSLENNGGFSSVRYRFDKIAVEDFTKIVLRLKGDGKTYQFRIKDEVTTRYSYIASFPTSGAWQEIAIPLNTMYPAFRGNKLDQPNFSHDYIEEVAFLIGNKRAERFRLLIDKIEIR
jgi:hypothetical protein